jgi:hypothetical protein
MPLHTSRISRPSLVGRKPVRKQQKKTRNMASNWHNCQHMKAFDRLRVGSRNWSWTIAYVQVQIFIYFFIAQTDRTITKMQINLFLRFWKPLLSQSLMLFALFLSFIFDRWEKCYILQICNIWLRTCKRYSNIQYLF